MRKHYIFIPLKKSDISSFRRVLISSLWLRPFACLLAIIALCTMGYWKRQVLATDFRCLVLFALASCIVLYLFIVEIFRLIQAGTLKKSSLLPFIHTPKEDDSFYSEELPGGFIIQTEPVNYVDIAQCRDQLRTLSYCCDNELLLQYLDRCINGKDQRLINKAVIYMEIILTQLEKGNKDILATCDTLKNCREDLL
ncbi:MAG: hypothetical protein ACI4DO_00555 [Roseburia sp.]